MGKEAANKANCVPFEQCVKKLAKKIVSDLKFSMAMGWRSALMAGLGSDGDASLATGRRPGWPGFGNLLGGTCKKFSFD